MGLILLITYCYWKLVLSLYTDEVQRNSTFAEDVFIQIPYAALCEDEEGVRMNFLSACKMILVCVYVDCSVVIGVSIIDNFVEYLQDSIDNFTDR